MLNLDLTGKYALVAGSTRGIGRAAAHELAELGATITLMARDERLLNQVRAALPTPQGQQHDLLVADFHQPDQVEERVRKRVAEGAALHILVNNTGGPPGGALEEADINDFLSAYRLHLLSNHLLMKNLTPGMKAYGYGRIVNVVSTSVYEPIKGLGVSNTTRGAVASWAKTLSHELAPHGITVNNVLPGATETDRLTGIIQNKMAKSGKTEDQVRADLLAAIPAGRFGQPEEVGGAIAFLCTPAAGYINGVSLAVDGGRLSSI